MKTVAVIIPDRDSRAHREARSVLESELLFAEVSVECQGRNRCVGLAENRLSLLSPDRDIRAKVQRVSHLVHARADFHDTAAQAGDVIDGRLQCPVIGTIDVGIVLTHSNPGQLAHPRVHRERKLLLLDLRGIILA